nr:MAG TPA: hypothetical protein [Crassvirales sp.]
MIVTDSTIIESAIPKYPELMSTDAEDKIKKVFYNLKEDESKLSKLRMEVIELEAKVKKEEELYRNISNLFEITFAKKEIQEIKNAVNMGIINPSDYRNTNI